MTEGLHQVGEGTAVELLEGLLDGADRPPLAFLKPWEPTRVSAVDQFCRAYGSGESSSAETFTFKRKTYPICINLCIVRNPVLFLFTEFIRWNENAKGVIR